MIKSINGKVWHTDYSFNGNLVCFYYAELLVMALNGEWFS